ncbi:hypothetical protein BXZ70DRAFT_133438 [Cristinia sonorae]|uniref:Uncharacterized protein n=1 Tax=Cristinia sonorae TaxID=1940300 RepID=A0A8K0UPZ1_9AGAR|nr:hypothetical protein BXZ70DRAFT_133438 [Cristinia sonorae]
MTGTSSCSLLRCSSIFLLSCINAYRWRSSFIGIRAEILEHVPQAQPRCLFVSHSSSLRRIRLKGGKERTHCEFLVLCNLGRCEPCGMALNLLMLH